jgi:hypothetical protein
MKRMLACAVILLACVIQLGAEEPQEKDIPPEPRATTVKLTEQDENQQELFRQFSEMLSGVKFVGQFTVVGGEERPPAKEEYEIRSVTKLPAGNLWLFQTRIKYGEHDQTLPLPLSVEWAGRTPVITLDNVTIPTLGTFGARVVIHDNKYAGTWSHGEVGGHLFGTIEKIKVEKEEKGEEHP